MIEILLIILLLISAGSVLLLMFVYKRKPENELRKLSEQLAALLNSLQMGFRTLAIEKRSSEVWEILGEVKTEFGKFGEVLAKTKKKLQEASHTIEKAEVRTRAIERKLRKVEQLPSEETEDIDQLIE